jgi:tRNA nucleotidyltransferase (CCA-adding enzyme)
MRDWFDEASDVLKRIEKEGFQAFYVGGCVRDYLKNRPIKDIDIATSAKPEEIRCIFPNTIPVGIEHGTVIVRHNHISYEVTTFRKEGKYKDYRRPSHVSFVEELEEDLARRDFTMNAMAMDVSLQLFDPFNGRKDLENQLIRTVGDPEIRFGEDPLRLMRACRFSSVYRMDVESETEKAIKNKAPLLKLISTERITEEFKKLLAGEWAGRALKFMQQAGLNEHLPSPLYETKEGALSQFDWKSLTTEEQRWAAVIIMTQSDEKQQFLKQWKLPNRMIHKVLNVLTAFETKEWTKMGLYSIGLVDALKGIELQCLMEGIPFNERKERLEQMFQEVPITSRNELPINGETIVEIKKSAPGIWVGRLLNELERAVVEGELSPSKDALVDWVRKWEKG